MLHILLTILKLFGIIILVLLGLIVLVFLLVMFSAMTYRIDGSKKAELEGEIKITWLIRLFSVRLVYRQGLFVTLRLFFFPVWKNKKLGGEPPAEEHDEEPGKEVLPPPEGSDAPVAPEVAQTPVPPEAPGRSTAPEPKMPDRLPVQAEAVKIDPPENQPAKAKEPAPKQTLAQKFKFSFQQFCDKLEHIKAQYGKIKTFVTDPENQKSARLIYRQMKKLAKHVLPRKGKITYTFGFEDPAVTGQILSYASVAYPFFHQILELNPVFDRPVQEAEIHVKGRLRFGFITGYLLKLFLDKNIRKQLWILLGKNRSKGKKNRRN